jgi:hypothetical protein
VDGFLSAIRNLQSAIRSVFMRKEIPIPIVVTILVVILGALGMYLFVWSNRSTRGTGISDEDLRKQVQYRQQQGMLPPSAGGAQNTPSNGQ